jgi:hypothetical protein
MRDGIARRVVKRVALLNFMIEVGLSRVWRRARGERPCQRSGGCCEAPSIAVGSLVWFMPRLRQVFLAWHRHVNGFELVREDPESQAFVFNCTHFDRASRSCDSFDSRPGMCRDYPRVLLWQPRPEFLPGCGYRARVPNAAGLRSALEKLDLTPTQREKLRTGLQLDDE